MKIDQWTADRIRTSANVVDVISDFLPALHKKGKEWQTYCPFHSDHHEGSFKVNGDKNLYYCFSCGASGDAVSFLMDYDRTRYTYVEALQYLAAKYGIPLEGANNFHPKPAKPYTPPPPLPTLIMPNSFIKHSRKDLRNDAFVDWLFRLKWDEEQRERISQVLGIYLVGTTQDASGFTIFWDADEEGNIRTGKMLRYDDNGHRRKDVKYSSDWVHARLLKAGKWDEGKWEARPCLYGLHLMNLYPDATINIVESEKTAILMSIAWGNLANQLWLATGGKSSFTREKLLPLIRKKRRIVAYPDADAIDEWERHAEEINYKHLLVNSEYVRNFVASPDYPKSDIADALLRSPQFLEQRPRSEPKPMGTLIDEWKMANPAFKTLCDNLELKEYNGEEE